MSRTERVWWRGSLVAVRPGVVRTSAAAAGALIALAVTAPAVRSQAVDSPESMGVSAIKGIPAPVDGVVGVDGRIWSISVDGRSLSRISTRTKKGRSAPLRVPGLRGLPGRAKIATGADGRITIPIRTRDGWGVLQRSVDGLDRRIVRFPRTAKIAASGISDLEPGPDGSVWFATTGRIGKVTQAGRVRSWAIPTRGGYPAQPSSRPQLAVAADGRPSFTAGAGVGSVSSAGRFGRWIRVGRFPELPLAVLVRGGDERLWALGGTDDDRIYRIDHDGTVTTTGYWRTDGNAVDERLDGRHSVAEALAPDPQSSILAIMGRQLDETPHDLDTEMFLRVGPEGPGVEKPQALPWNSLEAPDPPYWFTWVGPPAWDGIAASPGRNAIVPLPDGRIWVPLQDWDGWESYDKQDGTRTTPPKGRLRVGRVWRTGRTVLARVSCVGRTGGWCRTTLRAKVGREARRVTVVVPAAPATVHSTTTARVQLWRSQQAQIKRGRRVSVRVAGAARNVR